MLVTGISKETNPKVLESKLQQVLCIHHPAQFCEFAIKAFIDLSSKVNTMQPSFARKLGLRICITDIDAQTIDDNRLETFRMMIALFQVDDKDKKSRFLEKIFLLTDISLDIVFGIPFLILSNVEVNFNNRKFK